MIATCCVCGFAGAVEEIRAYQWNGLTAGRTRKSRQEIEFWICDVCYVNMIV